MSLLSALSVVVLVVVDTPNALVTGLPVVVVAVAVVVEVVARAALLFVERVEKDLNNC